MAVKAYILVDVTTVVGTGPAQKMASSQQKADFQDFQL